jgi:hypothetical protein
LEGFVKVKDKESYKLFVPTNKTEHNRIKSNEEGK